MLKGIDSMSFDKVKYHLMRTIDEDGFTENEWDSEELDNTDVRLAKGRQKMEPLIQMLYALNRVVGEVSGLDIKPVEIGPETGHTVIVQTQTVVTSDSYSISTNTDNSKFVIEEFCSISSNGSFRANNFEFDTMDDVLAKVVSVVGEHIRIVETNLEAATV